MVAWTRTCRSCRSLNLSLVEPLGVPALVLLANSPFPTPVRLFAFSQSPTIGFAIHGRDGSHGVGWVALGEIAVWTLQSSSSLSHGSSIRAPNLPGLAGLLQEPHQARGVSPLFLYTPALTFSIQASKPLTSVVHSFRVLLAHIRF